MVLRGKHPSCVRTCFLLLVVAAMQERTCLRSRRQSPQTMRSRIRGALPEESLWMVVSEEATIDMIFGQNRYKKGD